MKVAFIGAGQMGMPMVQRLVAAGRDVTVYARRPEVRDACAALGPNVTATGDLGDAVRDADAVVVCLYADDQLQSLALGEGGFLEQMPAGSVLVSHTTGSPVGIRQLAAEGATRRVAVVDAPVSGSAEDIAAGRVTVLLGGAAADVERAREVVAAYGDPVIHLGPLGSAQVVKLLNNALFAAHVQLLGEVDRIGSALGVDVPRALAAIQRSSGSSYALDAVERIGSVQTMAEAAGHFLHKDVTTVRAVADDLGVDLGELGHVTEHGPLPFTERTG